MPNILPDPNHSSAVHSWGGGLSYAVLPVGTAAPSWTLLLEIKDIVPPVIKVGVGKSTHLKSPQAWHEKIAGFKDGTQATFKGNWLDAQANTLFGTLRGLYVWLAQLPLQGTQVNPATVFFAGFLENFKIAEMNADTDDPVMSEVSIEVSGPVYYQVGS